MAAGDLTCFKCGATTPPKRATHTRDGRVACPNCTIKLGIRTEPRDGYMEITRMRERRTVETMRDRAAKRLKQAQATNHQGEVEYLAAIHSTLEWVLGEMESEPVEPRE